MAKHMEQRDKPVELTQVTFQWQDEIVPPQTNLGEVLCSRHTPTTNEAEHQESTKNEDFLSLIAKQMSLPSTWKTFPPSSPKSYFQNLEC